MLQKPVFLLSARIIAKQRKVGRDLRREDDHFVENLADSADEIEQAGSLLFEGCLVLKTVRPEKKTLCRPEYRDTTPPSAPGQYRDADHGSLDPGRPRRAQRDRQPAPAAALVLHQRETQWCTDLRGENGEMGANPGRLFQ